MWLHNFLPIIFAMPPHVNIGGHHIVLLKTVAKENHTTIPKRKLKTNETEQDIDILE